MSDKKVVNICCAVCNQHILDLDLEKANVPLRGDMMVKAGLSGKLDGAWAFPQGPINTDWYCPVCSSFPWMQGEDGRVHTVRILGKSTGTVNVSIEALVEAAK